MLRSQDRSDPLRSWSLIICVLLGGLLIALPMPYWRDAFKGDWFYVTGLGIGLYSLALVLVGILALRLSIPQHNEAGAEFRTLLLSAVIFMTPILKWSAIVTMGLHYFHNWDGLGREILGPIPNMEIDAVLGLASATLLLVLSLRYRKVNRHFKHRDTSL